MLDEQDESKQQKLFWVNNAGSCGDCRVNGNPTIMAVVISTLVSAKLRFPLYAEKDRQNRLFFPYMASQIREESAVF
jgi:hypothetical protein